MTINPTSGINQPHSGYARPPERADNGQPWTPPPGIYIGPDDAEPEESMVAHGEPDHGADDLWGFGDPKQPTGIEQWWRDTSLGDFAAFAPKLAEYGAHDLLEIGRGLARLMGWDNCPERTMYELGCWFYLKGKVERAFEALAAHRLPSDDTAHDATVYSMMIRRIRNRGELA